MLGPAKSGAVTGNKTVDTLFGCQTYSKFDSKTRVNSGNKIVPVAGIGFILNLQTDRGEVWMVGV